MITHIGGLVQNCSNSSALAMELLQYCIKPSMYASVESVVMRSGNASLEAIADLILT